MWHQVEINMGLTIKEIGNLLKDAFLELRNSDPLRLAAATAFFTTFALPAILIILIQIIGLIYNPEALSQEIFEKLKEVLGIGSAEQIKEVLEGFHEKASNWMITVGGFVFLIFVATTLFKVVKDSINQLWEIKLEHRAGFKKKLKQRAKALAVIGFTGILFLVTLLSEGLIAVLSDLVQEYFPAASQIFVQIIKQIAAIAIVTIWFTVLFKFLPDAKSPWKTALAGGFFTGVLFTIGKFLLGLLLSGSNIDNIYGASGSIVLLLLFVFYSSFILYFGATFTKQWGKYTNNEIVPREYAMFYELSEIKKEHKK
ncbi:MAG: YihY/virulence factor BrkB family protein [Bacteroidia bacterium]